MSQSLRSMKKSECRKIISRRLKENKRGLGYWAAVDARKKQNRA